MDDSKLTRSEFMQRDNKFTDVQKGYFKQLIADCLIKRFTTEESLLYLKDKLGVQIEEDEFHYLKIELKRDVKRNVQYLRRYEYAYIREYVDRIEEMRLIQNKLWKLAEGTDNPILQKDCLSELCKSTIATSGGDCSNPIYAFSALVYEPMSKVSLSWLMIDSNAPRN